MLLANTKDELNNMINNLANSGNYKDIQLFNPIDEKIGFDLTFMKGIDSVFQRSNRKLGIPKKYEQAYLALKHEQRT